MSCDRRCFDKKSKYYAYEDCNTCPGNDKDPRLKDNVKRDIHLSSREYLKTSSETKDQIALAQLLDSIKYGGRSLRWAAIPNGGKRDKRTAAILQKMGVKSGLMDILIFDTPPKYPVSKGAALEMKRLSDGIVSDEQKEWLDYFRENGWMAKVARGIDEAIEFLKNCGYIK